MKKVYEEFFSELIKNSTNLNQYVDQLYNRNEYSENELNEIFGYLRDEKLISFAYYDNRANNIVITFAGKHYFDSKVETMQAKKPKLFISHSSKDRSYVEEIVELVRKIGLSDDQIFCTSVAGFGINIDDPIIETLREQFIDHDLYVIFVHSDNYYNSAIALNEMGAAWALRKKATSILLPGFSYNQMKGVFGSERIAIKLDDYDSNNLKHMLNELRSNIIAFFGLNNNADIIWERDRDRFIETINSIPITPITEEEELTDDEADIISKAYFGNESIIVTQTLSGYNLQVGGTVIVQNGSPRDKANNEFLLRSLASKGYIEVVGTKKTDTIYQLTKLAYDYCDRKWISSLK